MTTIARRIAELGLTADLLKQGLTLLQQPREIYVKGKKERVGPVVEVTENRVALRETVQAERNVARHLIRLMSATLEPLTKPADMWSDFNPHPHQIAAIEGALFANVMNLTGGPGTGKTTIVKKVLQLFQHNGLKVGMMAPTGKAAIRMTEQTSFPATTIHRGLGFNGTGWTFHEGNPFGVSALILDEASMIDCELMAAVLSAVRTGTRVLIVGDVDQLPSIRPGRVLYDIISSSRIPTVRLTQIFRQASESRIPYVARDINEGRTPDNLAGEGTDVRFVERSTEEACLDLIIKAVTIGIPQQKGIPARDIQVLAAQKTKDIGVEKLNIALQSALNPTNDHELDVAVGSNYQVRKNDRVMHIQNNYDLGVMNGEMGWVLASNPRGVDLTEFSNVHTSEDADEKDDDDADDLDAVGYDDGGDGDDYADHAKKNEPKRRKQYVLVVEFDGRQIAYNKQEARELLLGYAITFHKSQGSQFKAVVLVVHSSHQFMLTRQLVYTGLTRAEKYALIVGQEAAIAKAARNTRGADRRTQLQAFIAGVA